MKIIKRNFEHRNIIIFLIFSVFYLQAVYSLSKRVSIFGVESLKALANENWFILAIVALTIFSIVKVKKYSDKLLLATLILISGKNFIMLSGSFNKLVLALNFIYLIFAFYFFITWELLVNKASFNPLFSRHDLEKEARFKIKAVLKGPVDQEVEGLITNIDEQSCFIYIPQHEKKLSPKGEFELTAIYEGVAFTQPALIVSRYDQGYGLQLLKPNKGPSWSDLYKVCLERGLFV